MLIPLADSVLKPNGNRLMCFNLHPKLSVVWVEIVMVAITSLQKGSFNCKKKQKKKNRKPQHINKWSWLGQLTKRIQILIEITSNGLKIYFQLILDCYQITWTGPVLNEFKKMDTSGQSSFTELTVASMPPGCASYMCKRSIQITLSRYSF